MTKEDFVLQRTDVLRRDDFRRNPSTRGNASVRVREGGKKKEPENKGLQNRPFVLWVPAGAQVPANNSKKKIPCDLLLYYERIISP